jgi:RNA polymerase-interacting CarD/CdnL/TRCF family regulator
MRERKDKPMPVQFSRREHLALERLSEKAGESMAAVVRTLVRAEAERLALWPTSDDLLALAAKDIEDAGPGEMGALLREVISAVEEE